MKQELLRLAAQGMRSELLRRTGADYGRNLDEVLKRRGKLTPSDYAKRFERDGIAARIVTAYPSATWREMPRVWETEDTEDVTEFEAAWDELDRRHGILSYLERVDVLAGLGRYAILLLGVPGSPDLSQPLQAGGASELLFLAPYGESDAEIETFDTDPSSERFGKPLTYKVDLAGSLDLSTGQAGVGRQTVHHTRVIHVAEGLLKDEVYGEPRLQKVWDDLDDIQKVVGGSAEMFWQGADRGLHANVSPDVQLEEEDAELIQEELRDYFDGLQRFIRTQGVELTALPSVTPDPSATAAVLFDRVSGATGIPKRLLLGSERGELASTQDRDNWADRVAERRVKFAENMLLRPLIERLQWLGILPAAEFEIGWPDLTAPSAKDRAAVSREMAAAIRTFVGTGGSATEVMTPAEFREVGLGLEPDMPYEQSEGTDATDTALVERIVAIAKLVKSANEADPNLNLHWAEVFAIDGMKAAPGAVLQAIFAKLQQMGATPEVEPDPDSEPVTEPLDESEEGAMK